MSEELRSANPTDAPSLTIHRESVRDGWMLTLCGELDIATSRELDAAVEELEQLGFGQVIIDVHEVSFIDSSGLASLVLAARRAREARRSLELIRSRGQVKRLLDLTGLNQRLTSSR